MNTRCTCPFLVVSMLNLMAFISEGCAETPDTQGVRAALERTWAAVDTLEIKGEEFLCDGSGHRDKRPGVSTTLFEITIGQGGRRAHKEILVSGDGGHKILMDFRQDGKKKRVFSPFEDDIHAIKSVNIMNHTDTDNFYRGPMVIATNLWTPFGRPLHFYLYDGGRLEVDRSVDGQERVVLVGGAKMPNLKVELDSDHGWQVRRIGRGQPMELVATQFGRDNGIWFPVEGYMTLRAASKDEAQQRGFRVTSLRINRPLPASTFVSPPLPQGVVVLDEMGGPSGFVGEREAARRLAVLHSVDTLKKGTPSAPQPYKPGAALEESRSLVPMVLGVASLALLALAILLKVRSVRNDSR